MIFHEVPAVLQYQRETGYRPFTFLEVGFGGIPVAKTFIARHGTLLISMYRDLWYWVYANLFRGPI